MQLPIIHTWKGWAIDEQEMNVPGSAAAPREGPCEDGFAVCIFQKKFISAQQWQFKFLWFSF
jgi:hypothetical protein